MPESSRTRSDSMEEAASQQDRKRPKLSSGSSDRLSSEEALTDAGCPFPPEPPKPTLDTTSVHEPDAQPDTKMPVSPNGVPSKVTINTRTFQTPNSSQQTSTPPQSPTTTAPLQARTIENGTQNDSDTAIEIIPPPPETISISSSPSRSPEIQVADPEDLDQQSGQTQWKSLNRRSSNTGQQSFLMSRHVHRTFPFARTNSTPGNVHNILPDISRMFESSMVFLNLEMCRRANNYQGNGNESDIFLRVKDWLAEFVQNVQSLTKGFIREEPDFWRFFPDLIINLLKRKWVNHCDVFRCLLTNQIHRIEPPRDAKPNDLEDFFVDFGRLCLLMIQYDITQVYSSPENVLPRAVVDFTCRTYLNALSYVLQCQYQDGLIPFYDTLRRLRNYNPTTLISSVLARLVDENTFDLLGAILSLVETISPYLAKNSALAHSLVQTLSLVSTLIGSVFAKDVRGEKTVLDDTSTRLQIIKKALQIFLKVDETLQLAVTKQHPWLTIEISPDIFRLISGILDQIAREDVDTAMIALVQRAVEPAVQVQERPPTTEVFKVAWKFHTLRKYITAGRMELRVYGMDTMSGDLVQAWRDHVNGQLDFRNDDLVEWLIRFIRETKLISYVVGIDSHPQLISKSANVIGFLCVTHTYQDSDTDTIWRAVTESQDPRTFTEVLSLLGQILPMSETSVMLYLFRKLMEMPIERFDARVLGFFQDLLQAYHTKSVQERGEASLEGALPLHLCIRLLRESSASNNIPQDHKMYIQRIATVQQRRQLKQCYLADEDRESLWTVCVNDIAEQNAHATGSLHALHAWVEEGGVAVISRLVRFFDLTKLLIHDLIELPRSQTAVRASLDDLEAACFARLLVFRDVIEGMPLSITEDLRDLLWHRVLVSVDFSPAALRQIWLMLYNVIHRQLHERNAFIEHVIEEYLPRIEPKHSNEVILNFVMQSVKYEISFADTRQRAEDEVVEIPGMDRVWRFVLEAPSGTVEATATEFIISQYLDHAFVIGGTKRSTEATHSALVDRCVQQVMDAASHLRAFKSDCHDVEDETMVIITSNEEVQVQQLRFDRSLLFLRQLLQGMKRRPRYSPPPLKPRELPQKPFEEKGNKLNFTYQPNGGVKIDSSKRRMSIGDLNTGNDLQRYLAKLTGFTQFSCFAGGQRLELRGNLAPLCDLRITVAHLLLQKVPETPEKDTSGRSSTTSALDSKLADHVTELYALLDMDNRNAREVFRFLDMFPVYEHARDLVQSMQAPVEDLLPAEQPYKLLYCAKALRSCIEDETFSTSPNDTFLRYSVHVLAAAISRPATMEADEALALLISHVLTECLVLALRAPVSSETSASYITDTASFAKCVVRQLRTAASSDGLEVPNAARLESHVLVREAFAALVESMLHEEQVSTFLQSDQEFAKTFWLVLLEDKRVDVRRVVVDVLLGLTGTAGLKGFSKDSDPRSARSRFSDQKIDGCLMGWWKLVEAQLPETLHFPTRCQQLFEVAIAIFNCIGKSLTTEALSNSFSSWAEILANYRHREAFEQPEPDYVVVGFTRLIHESHGLLPVGTVSVPSSNLLRGLLANFLFPNLSSAQSSTTEPQTPVLRESTREGLCQLVLSLSSSQEDFDVIMEHLDDLVPRDTYFEAQIQNDRLCLRSEAGYSGLRNLSNTCYLNSLFSQLFMNLEFRKFLFSASIAGGPRQQLISELSVVFAAMQASSSKSVDPGSAVGAIRNYENEQIDVSIQMDVDEFFNLLFDRLEGQILNSDAKQTFKKFYSGQLVQQIKSKECSHISERIEPFSAIQCEIKGKLTLEDSLRAYVEGEVMQGDNKYSCTGCNRHVDAVKRACLKDLPDHLIFNLKRFDFDILTMTRCKVNDEFRFPNEIDMAPYTVEHLSEPDKQVDSDLFELVGVLVHSGTAESGHYYSFIRERPSSKMAGDSWVQFNDSEVCAFDSSRLADCCFGGNDYASAMPYPKMYSAYMLFYQRKESIKNLEAEFPNRSAAQPVRLPLTLERNRYLTQENELFVRAYCAQDPSHARFVRQVLERTCWGQDRHCSLEHVSEAKALHIALDYMQQVSCRFKDLPEVVETLKLVSDAVGSCPSCAEEVIAWFCEDANFRDIVLRNHSANIRNMFGFLLTNSLRMLKENEIAPALGQLHARPRKISYQRRSEQVIAMLKHLLDNIWRYQKAVDDFFRVTSRISMHGKAEARGLLQDGFLEVPLEIIWTEDHFENKKMRKKYGHYISLREKGRNISLSGMIGLMSELLNRVKVDEMVPGRSQNSEEYYGGLEHMSDTEQHYTKPVGSQIGNGGVFDWVHKIICWQSNLPAIRTIVDRLAKSAVTAPILANTLALGLGADTVPMAAHFLDSTEIFINVCAQHTLVTQLVKESLETVDSINGHCGKEFLDFVQRLSKTVNEAVNWEQPKFESMVARSANVWAPTLLVHPDDHLHYNVGEDTTNFLNEILFSPLQTEESPATKERLTRCTRLLATACIDHIKRFFLPHGNSPGNALDSDQAKPMLRVMEHILRECYSGDNAEDEEFVTEATLTLTAFQQRARPVVETLSDSWMENDSAISDSDNADMAEFGTLGSPVG